MRENTLRKLRKNPHYMQSDNQLIQSEQVEYGAPSFHNQEVPIHPTRVVKHKRKRSEVVEPEIPQEEEKELEPDTYETKSI